MLMQVPSISYVIITKVVIKGNEENSSKSFSSGCLFLVKLLSKCVEQLTKITFLFPTVCLSSSHLVPMFWFVKCNLDFHFCLRNNTSSLFNYIFGNFCFSIYLPDKFCFTLNASGREISFIFSEQIPR